MTFILSGNAKPLTFCEPFVIFKTDICSTEKHKQIITRQTRSDT